MAQTEDPLEAARRQAGPDPSTDLISLRGILASLWRHAWILILTTAIGLGLAYHYAYNVATPLYRATASIMLENRERSLVNLQEATQSLSADSLTLNTEIGVLRGRELMTEVVETLDLDADPEFNPFVTTMSEMPADQAAAVAERGRDLAVGSLLSRTEIYNLPNTLIYEISVTTTDPYKSTQIANTIAETYIDNQVERKVEATLEAAQWLETRVGELQKELQQAESRVAAFRFSTNGGSKSDSIVQLEQLNSEAEGIRSLHNLFLTRLQETRAQQGLQRPDSRILSYAFRPFGPSSPRYTMLMVAGGVAGLFLGLVIVFIREASIRSIRTRDEMERLTGLPVIGELPRVGMLLRRSRIKGLIGPRARLYGEALNGLLTTLYLSRPPVQAQIIVLVSSQPGEGKTSLALSMARRIAMYDKRVLVIDGDMRKRTLTRQARCKGAGLLSVLQGMTTWEETVRYNDALAADVLSCEAPTANTAGLLGQDRFERLLAEVRQRYDTIIIDTPPLMAVPDALPFAKAADVILFLVRWRHTHAETVQDSLKALDNVGLAPTGVVITRMKETALSGAKYAGYFIPARDPVKTLTRAANRRSGPKEIIPGNGMGQETQPKTAAKTGSA